jgi:DNA helicase-2/ATP-dependent DNA helicase PcrA
VTTPVIPDEVRQAMGATPTEEQWAAISMPLEPYVIVAGAGSGKTSVMAARVVYLALVAMGRVQADHAGVMPGNLLCLTFTNKATENLLSRVRGALWPLDLPEGEEPEVLNYHAFAAHVLERHGLLIGVEPGQRVLTQAQRAELCGRVLDTMSFEHVQAEWQPSVVTKILELTDQAANHCIEPDAIVEFNRARLEELQEYRSDRAYQAALERIELAGAVQAFHALKRGRGLIDFADQIELALRICEEHPEVAAQYRDRFHAVLLDEYQDTNVAQARLIAALFGDGYPVTAVGDPDQNIYAWRGASLYNLLQFPQQFPRADGTPARKLPLYTNFRSGAHILEAADHVISPLPTEQRPDPDKALVPFEANGLGEVELVRHPDEWSEAVGIAERLRRIHDEGGEAWSTCAVLCRTSRLFYSLQEVFRERDIPVEVVGLAGLLTVPEVVEVLAYARAVADPFASVALARILLGPRYRVGFKDLARVAAWSKEQNYRRGRSTEEGEVLPFLFAEALEHLDQTEGVSDEARGRLETFRAELRDLREQARRPVGEFMAEVIRRIGLLEELDASPDREIAAARKRNLAAFLDEVHAFAPVEGELTLRAFLDYVDQVEAADKPEWSPVQPSGEDSVKVMTIHQAKGLEFDNVFVPGLALDLLPSNRIQQNPAERGKSLDFELRGDADVLPRFEGNFKAFKEALKEQELIEERRTCYVALTRARRRLFVSGAWWYGETQRAKKPSRFLEELAEWAADTGHATVNLGPEPDDENPLIGYRERLVRDWPGRARADDADGLFADGPRRAALEASRGGVAAAGPAEDAAAFEEAADANRAIAQRLIVLEQAEAAGTIALPGQVGVSGLVDYARCPKLFYWSAVRPLPRFSGPYARIGTEIHRWIETRSSGQTSLMEVDDRPDLTAEELAGEPGRIDRLRQAFLDSRFAEVVPLHAERPFVLRLEEFVVGGRIDAVYETTDGKWEIVDYKTGSRPKDESIANLQLDVYALACADVWGKTADDLRLTYLYLGTGEAVTRECGDLGAVRERVLALLRSIAAARFDPTPGEQCRWCDFRTFCDAGKAWLAANPRT